MPFDSNYLGDDQVKAEIELSFSPMRCVAQFSKYHHSIGFRVEDLATGRSWRMDYVLMQRARQKRWLRNLVALTRQHILWKGGHLDPLQREQ